MMEELRRKRTLQAWIGKSTLKKYKCPTGELLFNQEDLFCILLWFQVLSRFWIWDSMVTILNFKFWVGDKEEGWHRIAKRHRRHYWRQKRYRRDLTDWQFNFLKKTFIVFAIFLIFQERVFIFSCAPLAEVTFHINRLPRLFIKKFPNKFFETMFQLKFSFSP